MKTTKRVRRIKRKKRKQSFVEKMQKICRKIKNALQDKKSKNIKRMQRMKKQLKNFQFKKSYLIMGSVVIIALCIGGGIAIKNHMEVQEAARIEAERVAEEEALFAAELAKIGEVVALLTEEYSLQKLIEDTENMMTIEESLAVILEYEAMIDAAWANTTEITTANADGFATVESCQISTENTSKVVVSGNMESVPKSDDRQLHIFNIANYESAITSDAEPITSIDILWDGSFSFEVNLNYNQSNSRLYDKFVVAVLYNGSYITISEPQYITNPEAIATYTYSYPEASSIKGLLVDPASLGTSELDDLGVKQAVYNIPIGNILGQTTNAIYPTIYYTYNGNTYAFNGQTIAEYDLVFGTLTNKGIQTTAVILNNWNSSYIDAIHPDARSGGSAPYYMFNGTTEAGVDLLSAVGSFLATRYSGTSHGQVVNWVIANEINARSEWNYIASTDVVTYTEEYVEGFRVFYNAIKSVNACARVYMPIDQTWDRNLGNNNTYDAKDVLDTFNDIISSSGNIDWGVSHHPYPVPLTYAAFWAMPSNYASMNLLDDTFNTKMISMINLHVLTDYLQQDYYLTYDGEVRSVILGELGFTSSSNGQSGQAAAFAYAYYIAEANQYIDGMLLSRQTDAAEEVAQGIAVGLKDSSGNHKQIYSVYKQIDTSSSASATEFAKSIIGISDWSEVITQY